MSVLLTLPTELGYEILDKWLEIEQWSLLDVAVSKSDNHLRAWLLDVFKLLSNCTESKKFSEDYHGPSVFKWISARGIRLSSLLIEESMVFSDFCMIVALDLESVADLHTYCHDMDDYIIINCCTNLKHLRIMKDVCNFDRINPRICSGLVTIDIEWLSAEGLLHIRDNCTLLKTLMIKWNQTPINTSVLACIIEKNAALEHLEAFCDISLLSTIRLHSQRLKRICLLVHDFTLIDIIDLFAETFRMFVKFDIVGDNQEKYILYTKEKLLLISYCDYDSAKLVEVMSHFTGLERITLTCGNKLNDEVIYAMTATNSTSLKSLCLRGCALLTAKCLKDLLIRCKDLKVLEIDHGNLTACQVKSIFSDQIPNKITTLWIWGGEAMSGFAVIHLLNACMHLEDCTILNLPGLHADEELQQTLQLIGKTKVSSSSGIKLKLVVNNIEFS